MLQRLFAFILISLTVISCSKSDKNYTIKEINRVKTFQNKKRGSVEELNFKPVELFTITANDSAVSDTSRSISSMGVFQVDSKENIYVLDRNCSVKKFDKSGKFIKSFGNRGTGPGETSMSWNMTVLNDTIIYDDYTASKMVKFDTDGNFLDNIPIKASGMPERFAAVGNNSIVGYQGHFETVDNVDYSSYNFTLMDSRFQKDSELFVKKIKFVRESYNFFDIFLSAYTVSPTEIFFAIKSDHKYQIMVYDHNGNLKNSITKSYAQLRFSNEVMDQFQKRYERQWYFSNNKSKFKSAIVQMEYDKYGRLWVFSSQERDDKNRNDLIADVFKDNIFLKTVKLDIAPGFDYVNYDHQVFFRGSRLYYANGVDQEIKVYDY